MLSGSGSSVFVRDAFIGARTRTMVVPIEAIGISNVTLSLRVPWDTPAKASFFGKRPSLPTWAGVQAAVSTVVRRSNYARYAPAALGSATNE